MNGLARMASLANRYDRYCWHGRICLTWEGLARLGRLGIVGQLDQGGVAWHGCDGVSTRCSESVGYGAIYLPSFHSLLR
jgi:hypothetical protein